MKLLYGRQYSSFRTPPNLLATGFAPSRESKIIQLCRSSSLHEAISLLNNVNSEEISIKSLLYASLIQACTKAHSFNHGLQIHAHIVKSGLETDRFVGNSMLALYFKLGSTFSEAKRVFDCLVYKDVVSWTSMISGYIRLGKPRSAMGLFLEMLEFGVDPNAFTLSAVIKASTELGALNLGRCLHGVVFRGGFESNQVIGSSLIDMYGRSYESKSACQVFDELLQPDSICWTSVISALTRNDLFIEAMGLFYSMLRMHCLSPDGFTFGTILTACGNLGRPRQGKEVHARVITAGLCGNVVVESSLLDMYGKCRLVEDSRHVFDRMTRKNSVSWSALLGAYCQNGNFDTVIELFREMNEMDLYCFGTVVRACAGLSAIRQGKEVHCQYLRRGGWSDIIVESALVDLYAKCGCVDFAYRIFMQMPRRNLITWNSMICGFAQNGRGEETLAVFQDMLNEGITPDYISFVGVIFACSHTVGLADEGRKHFISMTEEYGIRAGIEHYSCMVDLLGRAGRMEEAEALIQSTAEFRDESSLWAALLGACTTSTDSAVAERIAKRMIEVEPDYHLSYVLLANVYRALGRWNDAVETWRLMEKRKVKKLPGKSWIDSDVPAETEYLRNW